MEVCYSIGHSLDLHHVLDTAGRMQLPSIFHREIFRKQHVGTLLTQGSLFGVLTIKSIGAEACAACSACIAAHYLMQYL